MVRRIVRVALAVATAGLVVASTVPARAQSDIEWILQFQRAADSYAFAHRQADLRGTKRATASEGAFFTPQVAAVFRARLIAGASRAGCARQTPTDDARIPAVNASSSGTQSLSPCLLSLLPPLPPELEYRRAGVALILADAHLHIVVDILHGAFPVT